jgi:hypothetical protein
MSLLHGDLPLVAKNEELAIKNYSIARLAAVAPILSAPTPVATRQPTLLVSSYQQFNQSINALCRSILAIAYCSVIMSPDS